MGDDKKSKSFNLKKENAEKVEKIAFEDKRFNKKQSAVVDKAIEEFDPKNAYQKNKEARIEHATRGVGE